MELFRKVAREHGAGVIVVIHDQRTLEVFDTIYEMENGAIRHGPMSSVTRTNRNSNLRRTKGPVSIQRDLTLGTPSTPVDVDAVNA